MAESLRHDGRVVECLFPLLPQPSMPVIIGLRHTLPLLAIQLCRLALQVRLMRRVGAVKSLKTIHGRKESHKRKPITAYFDQDKFGIPQTFRSPDFEI